MTTRSERIPHPIPYQGSKRALASTVLLHAPARFHRLVEPFAGSAAISLAAAHAGLTDRFWINDAHQPLIALWRAILDGPHELADKYEDLWQAQSGKERAFFDEVRSEFNRTQLPGHFLYLLARCVKAAVRYNADGEFNNTPDNRRKGARPEEMRSRIRGASALLAGKATTTCADYRDVLAQCSNDDLIYMDPPYQGVSRRRDSRYGPHVDHREFRDALAELNRRGRLFIVSYDGRTGRKEHGQRIPADVGLKRLELRAGRSSQATLLGRDHVTYESLYLSSSLVELMSQKNNCAGRSRKRTLACVAR